MRRIYWLIWIMFLLPAFLAGKRLPPHLKFWRINELNGLQVELVNDIKQGPLGFIWLATNDGLYRYDGLNFVCYRHEPDNPHSLPNNSVSRLFFDSKNTFWVLTDHGIVKYNYATNQFDRMTHSSDEEIILNSSTNGIAEASDGSLYISTYDEGITCYKGGMFFPLLDHSDHLFSDENIMTILLQGDTLLWIGTSDHGLISYHINTHHITYYADEKHKGIDTKTVYSLYEDSKKNLWVGTNNGLIIIPPDSNPFRISRGKSSNMPDNKILSVLEDHQHRIWIGTGENGLLMIPIEQLLWQKEKSVFIIYEASDRLTTISYRTVSCIYQDKSKYIWLGTYNDGLNVFYPDGEKVTSYMHYPNMLNSLPHNRVWGICEDHQGYLWIGTDGNGITRIDPFTVGFKHFPYQNGKSNGPNDKAILAALCDRNDNLWFGTYLGGISFYDQKKQIFQHFFKKPDGSYVFARNDVRSIHESKDGTIWAGTNRGGLYRYNEKTCNFEIAGQETELDIRSITSDSKGILWMGTYGSGGLFSYNPVTNLFESHSLQEDIKSATPVIYSVCMTSDSVLWLGSQYFGLIRYNTYSKEKKIYTTAQGLAHNTIKAVVKENDSSIWLSTETGISSFNIISETFSNYTASDGFLSGLFNDNSGLLSQNGYLAFGGDNGLNLFYPQDLKKSRNIAPTIAFTDFKLFNMSLMPGTGIKNNPLSRSIWIEDTIHLLYNQNVFTLEFVAQEYPFSKGWNYEFIMEGYDEDWNKVKGQNNCTYRNLPPGEYKFRVRVVGKSDIVHGPERSILIMVKPPWWRTLWAYSLFFIMVGIVVWIVIRYQFSQIKLKNSLYYEKMLRQKESGLTQEKLRFYTNFSHEMRTPLTLILGPCNDLSNQNPRSDQQSKIDIIKRNAYYLLELLNKLLEFRKIESNKIMLNVTYSDINVLIMQEIEFFRLQARQKNIGLTYKIIGEPKGWADFSSLQIVLNNLLSNAVKFTPVGGFISLSSKNEQEMLTITVENSGEGLSEKDRQEIFTRFFQGENAAGHGGTGIGLALCKNLAELHNGNISVESIPGEITKFAYTIPVSKHNYEQMSHVRFIREVHTLHKVSRKPHVKNVIQEETTDEPKKLVLVVDDNYDLIAYLYSILSSTYEVISANDGKSGIDIAKEQIPDLIISDVMMPEKSGMELCQELKTDIKTSHIPIILLTAKHSNETKIEGFKKGADCYIMKPFDSAVLLSQINALFHNRQLLRHFFQKDYSMNRKDKTFTMEEAFLIKLENCILQMFDDDIEISVPELCKTMGFSRTSLYRKVKAISDLSINQIIRSVKLRKSAEMIRQGNDMTISQIAFNLGFNDIKYFRECFKEQFDMTPSEYKKIIRNT